MKKGKIKFVDPKNNFGFILETETGKEYYFHVKDLLESVSDNDEVEFEIAERKRGPAAIAVKKAK
jgi:CspA family cold shock protein